jgi:hypothetical protein
MMFNHRGRQMIAGLRWALLAPVPLARCSIGAPGSLPPAP